METMRKYLELRAAVAREDRREIRSARLQKAIDVVLVIATAIIVALVAFGCAREEPYNPEAMNASTLAPTSCPTNITILTETWSAYCDGSTPKAKVVITFELDGALPNGPGDLSGVMSTGAAGCLPFPTQCGYDVMAFSLQNGVYTATADGFPFDCVTGPPPEYYDLENFTRWGGIQARCGTEPVIEHLFNLCSAMPPNGWGFVSLSEITCGGHGGGPGEEGVEPDDSTTSRYNVHRLTCPAHDNPNAACVCDAAATAQEWADYFLGWGWLD